MKAPFSRRLPASLALPLIAALAAPAWACGPYRLAFYEYSALYYRGPDGQFHGIDKDMVDELARRSGCRFETVLESRARIWAQMTTGQLDLTVSVMPTPERERHAELVPYLQSRQYMLVRREQAGALATPEAFLADAGRRLLVVRAYVFVPPLQSLVEQLRGQGRVVEAADQPAALRAFKAGRADGLILGANSLTQWRQQDPDFGSAISALDYAPGHGTVGALAMSRRRVSSEDRALLRHTLEEMQQDGSMATIWRRHLGELAPPQGGAPRDR